MKDKYDWENAFGSAPAAFRDQVNDMLDRLEDEPMKKRYKFSTVLLAAALIAVLLAGGAFAARQLGLLNVLTENHKYIQPLNGAEALVNDEQDSAESEYLTAAVEEALYDGTGVMASVTLTLKDPDTFALSCGVFDENEDDYFYEDREIVDEAGSYYERVMLGRKDGKKILAAMVTLYSGDAQIGFEEGTINSDGSASLCLISRGDSGVTVDPDDCKLSIVTYEYTPGMTELPETTTMEIPLKLKNSGEVRRMQLTQAAGSSEYFEILSGTAEFTLVRGSIEIEYLHEKQAEYEPMGIDLFLYDAEGNRIEVGGGEVKEEKQPDGRILYRQRDDVQTFAEIPERIFVEAHAIDSGVLPGRIECVLTPIE